MSPVGDDFIDVHVGLGSGTRLPDDQRKLFIEFAFEDFVTNAQDPFFFVLRQHAVFCIRNGSSFFQIGKCTDDFNRHPVDISGNFKILNGALRLCTPIDMCRHLHDAHRIFFLSVFHDFKF